MRIVVTGGRGITGRVTNELRVFEHLDRLHTLQPISLLIEGGQRTTDKNTKKIIGGVDFWASRWAYSRRVQCLTVPAKWDDFSDPCLKKDKGYGPYNALAGPNRNRRMMRDHGAELLVAFPGGAGTANAIAEAKRFGIRVLEIPFEECQP